MATAIIETITPEKAREYFETSRGNRNISERYVSVYADEMKNGTWKMNGVPIIFDYDGNLIDGHHRLLAIIKANVPVTTAVFRGVDPKCFTTIDVGRGRNLAQIISIDKDINYAVCSSIVTIYVKLKYGYSLRDDKTLKLEYKSMNYLYSIYQQDRDRIGYCAQRAIMFRKRANILPVSIIGGIYYYLLADKNYQEGIVYNFFNCLMSLNNSDNKAIELLRVRLFKEKLNFRKVPTEVLFAFVIKTWNYYISNISPKILRFDPEKEEYPTLK